MEQYIEVWRDAGNLLNKLDAWKKFYKNI